LTKSAVQSTRLGLIEQRLNDLPYQRRSKDSQRIDIPVPVLPSLRLKKHNAMSEIPRSHVTIKLTKGQVDDNRLLGEELLEIATRVGKMSSRDALETQNMSAL